MSPRFRIEDGVPICDGKSYPWAHEVNSYRHEADDGRTLLAPYDGFTLLLENGWEVHVMWANYEDRGWPEFQPSGEVCSVDAAVRGLAHTLSMWNPELGAWPYEPASDWCGERIYTTHTADIDRYIAVVAEQPMAPWLASVAP